MSDQLPRYIDPLQLADKRAEFHGHMPLDGMGRLCPVLANDDSVLTINMFFGREGRLAKIEGNIQTLLKLKCQNCLNALDLPVDHAFKLGILTSIDEVERLPNDYEPLLLETDKITLQELIEDELLLIVPEYPKHEYDCLSFNFENKIQTTDNLAHSENPFSILTKLKQSGDL